jgi:hypothetical protein
MIGTLSIQFLCYFLEKRKAWIYEVPLTAVHHLRESLNAVPAGQDIPEDLLVKYDAPIIAATVRLWMLELDPPLGMYEGWDEVRKLYPQGKLFFVLGNFPLKIVYYNSWSGQA